MDNHFDPDTGLSFTITDLKKSDDWQILEKKIKGGAYRLGTFLKKKEIDNSIRQSIIDFVLTNKNPFFEIFIIDNKGEFLVNESGIFPGRAIAGKEQQTKTENVLRSILDSKQNPEGKIIEFIWEVPGIKPVIVQRKKIFAEYNAKFDWFICIGIDIEKLHAYQAVELFELKNNFKKVLFEFCVFIVFLFVFLLLRGFHIGRKTSSGFEIFQRFMEKANTVHEPIDCSRLLFAEFRDLGRIANEMVEDRQRQKKTIITYIDQLNEANRKLKDKSDRDGLTGIHNRVYFDEALEKAWRDAIRLKKPVSVGMIDIDFFKQYNDTYGHPKGDECLITVAEVIRSVLNRPYDLVARYGGEEFVVLFPDTGSDGAMQLAVLMKERIAEKNIEHRASVVSSRLTFSMGLATIFPNNDSLPKSIIKNADDALYKAKKEGRDRIFRQIIM